MTDYSSLLDINRYPSVPLIDVESAQEKPENLGDGLSLTETHLLPFAFREPRVGVIPVFWSVSFRCHRVLLEKVTSSWTRR